MWGINSDASKGSLGPLKTMERVVPPIVSVTSLVLKAWLHDSINLVTIRDTNGIEDSTLYAFKTNYRVHQLYQEINSLLNLPPHENIIQISFLVTKSTLYSIHNPLDPASLYLSKPTQPIIGFLTPYHSGGRIGDALNFMSDVGTLTTKHKVKWARQLTSALLHVYKYENGDDKSRCGVYTNLKMDNIILTSPEDNSNIILIDFEKGQNWEIYEPPEIDHEKIRAKRNIKDTTDILLKPNSIHKYVGPIKMDYENQYWGSKKRSNLDREASMVWSLGCCLWCILYGHRCLRKALYDESPYSICSYSSDFLGRLWRKPGIPKKVQAIITKCFIRRRSQRSRLEEVLHVLEEWEKDLDLEKEAGDVVPTMTDPEEAVGEEGFVKINEDMLQAEDETEEDEVEEKN